MGIRPRTVGRAMGVALVLAILAPTAFGAALQNITCRQTEQGAVIELTLDHQVPYHFFGLRHPSRVVLDLTETHQATSVGAPSPGLIEHIRTGIHKGTGLRIVVDLDDYVSGKAQWLKPASPGAPRQLRVVLHSLNQLTPAPAASVASSKPVGGKTAAPASDASVGGVPESRADIGKTPAPAAKTVSMPTPDTGGPIVVMIDPGHGGKDPGTKGAHGLQEKVVTLAIGRQVARLLNAQPGVQAVLTRSGDHFISLTGRVEDAIKHRADVFVSIHANASPQDQRVKGGAVYMLSDHGATSSEARAVARWENSRDSGSVNTAGLPLSNNDRTLNTLLVDLFQRSAMVTGYQLGKHILHHLAKVEPLYEHRVQRANFAVLRDPAVPSVLVETAFLSNPRQAAQLHRRAFRDHLARAIANGIMGYIRDNRTFLHGLPGHMQPKTYQVQRGDTLSGIASDAGISLRRLRTYNHLRDDTLRVGQLLRIPATSG